MKTGCTSVSIQLLHSFNHVQDGDGDLVPHSYKEGGRHVFGVRESCLLPNPNPSKFKIESSL